MNGCLNAMVTNRAVKAGGDAYKVSLTFWEVSIGKLICDLGPGPQHSQHLTQLPLTQISALGLHS